MSAPDRAPAPRRGIRLLRLTLLGLAAVVVAVLAARGLRGIPAVEAFIDTYPGDATPLPGTPVGFPWWLSWQHALNGLLLLLIVRTGWQIGSKKRPPNFWTRRNTGILRTATPPRRLSIHVWFHLSLDVLWIVNGVLYVALLLVSGHVGRLVPASWDVVPHALSVAVQYASLDWPAHDGWVQYNALQLLFYGFTVFVAAPVAILTGVRLSTLWKPEWRFPPEKLTRTVHVLTMMYFLVFTAAHVALVLTTGALRNLNHMYAGRDDESWIGAILFAVQVLVLVGAWALARPALLARLAALSGDVR